MDGRHIAAAWAAALGLATLATAAMLALIPPQAHRPDGPAPVPTNTILSIELVRNAGEAIQTLGRTDDGDDSARERAVQRRAALDHINRLDYAFMTAYSLYCGALAWFAAGYWQSRRPWARNLAVIGAALAVAMFAGDVVENEQLYRLTAAANAEAIPQDAIAVLVVWTRVKWFALAAASVVIALLYVGGACRSGRRWTWAIPVAFTAAGLCIAATVAIDAWRSALGLGTALLALAWALALLQAAGSALRPTR